MPTLIARDGISSVLQNAEITINRFTPCSEFGRKFTDRGSAPLVEDSEERQDAHDLPLAPARSEPRLRLWIL
jgi:hypothetical protein